MADPPIRVHGVDHVVLNVADGEASMRWWVRHFGAEVVRYDEWKAGDAPFLSVRLGPTLIVDLLEAPVTGTNVDHVSLWVDADLDAVVEAGELAVEWGPVDLFGAQGVGPALYVQDPDGHRIELKTYRPGDSSPNR